MTVRTYTSDSGVERRTLAIDSQTEYFRYRPTEWDPSRAPMVCVHGAGRQAMHHIAAFRSWADLSGTQLLAPVFDHKRYRGYRRLRSSNHDLSAAAALQEILRESCISPERPQCYLYGFASGAQFANRYAMVHPKEVLGLALGSADRYASFRRRASFPRWSASDRLPDGLRNDIKGFLNIRKRVFVGELAAQREVSADGDVLPANDENNTRLVRAQHWVSAINRAAEDIEDAAMTELVVMRGVRHQSRDCYRYGSLDIRVCSFFEQLIPQGSSRITAASDSGSYDVSGLRHVLGVAQPG